MTDAHTVRTTADFVLPAAASMTLGFDDVKINGGVGKLLDQSLHLKPVLGTGRSTGTQ